MSLDSSGVDAEPVDVPHFICGACGFEGVAQGVYDPEIDRTVIRVDCPSCAQDAEDDLPGPDPDSHHDLMHEVPC